MNNTQIHKYTCTNTQTFEAPEGAWTLSPGSLAGQRCRHRNISLSSGISISQTPWIHKYYKFMSTVGFRGCFIFKGPLWSKDWVLLLYTNIYFEAFVKSFEVLLIFFSEYWIKSNTYDSKVERNPFFPTLVWVTLVCSSGLPSLGWGQGLPLSAAHHLHLITHFFWHFLFARLGFPFKKKSHFGKLLLWFWDITKTCYWVSFDKHIFDPDNFSKYFVNLFFKVISCSMREDGRRWQEAGALSCIFVLMILHFVE